MSSVANKACPAAMQIYWNKRKCFHNKSNELPQDWFGTSTWPPFHCFGTPVGNSSTHVFETRTVAGSELPSLLTCPHTTIFTLLSIFSSLEMSSIKNLGDNTVLACEIFSSGCVRVSKTRVLKLPIVKTRR